jgi:hypothetical protein
MAHFSNVFNKIHRPFIQTEGITVRCDCGRRLEHVRGCVRVLGLNRRGHTHCHIFKDFCS